MVHVRATSRGGEESGEILMTSVYHLERELCARLTRSVPEIIATQIVANAEARRYRGRTGMLPSARKTHARVMRPCKSRWDKREYGGGFRSGG